MTSDQKNTLDNEITLVTGASRGIGAGIAQLFGKSGSYVIGTATTQDGAKAITQRMLDDGLFDLIGPGYIKWSVTLIIDMKHVGFGM